MDKILVGTPLRVGSVSQPYNFSDGVAIRTVHPILWDISVVKAFMSDEEHKQISGSRYWLCASKEIDNWHSKQPDDYLYEKVRRAMYALQIICPFGGLNQYLTFHETPTGLDNIGGLHPAKMTSTLMGRIAALDESTLQLDFDAVFQGVNQAFDGKAVRLQNPILLLEHGLQTNHVYLSTLMWVMALDMLYMAGEKGSFVERIGGFLGTGMPIFPPFFGQQPRLTVGEILNDLYELRNLVSHGREIRTKPFLENFEICDTFGTRFDGFNYSYAQVLMESALFLLVRSLRKVTVDGLVDVVRDDANWKQTLKTCARLEHARLANDKEA